MHDLLNIAPCGVLVFNDAGRILEVNGTLARLLKYKDSELEAQHIDSIFSIATRIFYSTHFFPLVKLHGKATEIFLTLIGKEKDEIPVLCNAVRREHQGNYENIAVFMPVFERKKYEQEILQARRTAEDAVKENKGLQKLTEALELRTQELEKQNRRILAINQDLLQFNKIISHDLQEPIRKIKLFASVLTAPDDGQSPDRSKMAVSKIETSAERLGKLTKALQQYVNVDAEASHTMVNLNETLAAAASRVRALREYNDFEIRAEGLPSIEGYPAQLELLFYHLIDNAIQFRRAGAPVRIGIDHTLLEENIYRSLPDKYKFVEHVRIIFSDNGIGFDSQFKDYVFDMVKKIDAGTKNLGMGLALIKKIVTNHGGTVRIESQEGKGTQVIIVLPLRIQ